MARPASDIAERVVVAARARFLAEGVAGASLRAIARDAGTNLGMVYYYFSTKDALFMAVVEEVYAKLLDDLARVLAAAGPNLERQVRALYGRLAELSELEVDVLGLVLREALGSSSRAAGLFARFARGHIPLLVSVFTQAQARDEARRELPPLVLVIGTLAAGILPQLLRRRLETAEVPVSDLLPGPKELADLLSKLVLNGMSKSVDKRW
ncbi:MAG: TetR/AcrR family transcriptional regulator [Myxococcales bacterium]